MVYYYAQTGHKIGLDRARRGTAVVKALQSAGIEAALLANDFRAGVAMKELGLRDYITVETILDVDAVAKEDDAVMVDSCEEDKGKTALYAERFACFGRVSADTPQTRFENELLMVPFCDETSCIDGVVVDAMYAVDKPKTERILFFYGDADYDKTVLSNKAFFQEVAMELVWGHYFFVKYEDALAELFPVIHESETYADVLTSSTTVVTASSQTALEARAAGAKTVYIRRETCPNYNDDTLRAFGVDIIDGFDAAALQDALKRPVNPDMPRPQPFDATSLAEKCKHFS